MREIYGTFFTPGFLRRNSLTQLSNGAYRFVFSYLSALLGKSPWQGSLSVLHAATATECCGAVVAVGGLGRSGDQLEDDIE